MHKAQTEAYEQMLQRAAYYRWAARKAFANVSHYADPVTGAPMRPLRDVDGRLIHPGVGDRPEWRGEERAANIARARYWYAQARAYRERCAREADTWGAVCRARSRAIAEGRAQLARTHGIARA